MYVEMNKNIYTFDNVFDSLSDLKFSTSTTSTLTAKQPYNTFELNSQRSFMLDISDGIFWKNVVQFSATTDSNTFALHSVGCNFTQNRINEQNQVEPILKGGLNYIVGDNNIYMLSATLNPAGRLSISGIYQQIEGSHSEWKIGVDYRLKNSFMPPIKWSFGSEHNFRGSNWQFSEFSAKAQLDLGKGVFIFTKAGYREDRNSRDSQLYTEVGAGATLLTW